MNASLCPARSLIFKSLFLTAAFLAGMFTLTPVLAQTDQAADAQAADDDMVLEEVVVTGIRRSLDFSADIKRESSSLVDAITAQDIGLFSDNNIGEAHIPRRSRGHSPNRAKDTNTAAQSMTAVEAIPIRLLGSAFFRPQLTPVESGIGVRA